MTRGTFLSKNKVAPTGGACVTLNFKIFNNFLKQFKSGEEINFTAQLSYC